MKKVWIASILATLMLTVPLSSVVGANEVEDCNCNTISDSQIVRIERLLDRIESRINFILLKYGHILEVKEKCNEILDILNIDEILEIPYPLRCKILYEIMNRYIEKCEKFLEKLYTLLGSTELAQRIVFILYEFLLLPFYPWMILYVLLLCENYPFTLDKLNISYFVMQLNI